MSVSGTAAEQILEDLISVLITAGSSPTTADITSAYNAFVAGRDLSKPLLTTDTYKVVADEVSSVDKYNAMKVRVQRDLLVAYTELFNLTDSSMKSYDRWVTGSALIEKRLADLDSRIDSLLLLTQDVDDFVHFTEENFTSVDFIDLENSTVTIDPILRRVSIPASNTGATRINLNGLLTKDIEFNVLSRSQLVVVREAPNTSPLYAVHDTEQSWQSRVYMASSAKPVLAEYQITMSEAVDISKIRIQLHASNTGSTIQVTPLLSADGINFTQIASNNFTSAVLKNTVFTCAPTSTKVVKLLLTKISPDTVDGKFYVYEFGATDIAIFSEGYPV